ncbi:hypothetical protein [Salinithrix halophila]|uniref:Uncharacterized protein n=1 Tax=Salinithrix halophila TaxID=1485204 RepID=A0ABV8JBP8_9BACL
MDRLLSTGCPVCNGFETQNTACPHCSEWMEDRGRFFDILADYSPYRPIDDLKRTDGFRDLEEALCPHQLFCRKCGYEEVIMIHEIRL